jgi:hypothetical protein
MAHVASPSLVRQLGSLFEGGSTAGLGLLGRGETDSDGRFRLEAERTSAVRFFDVHALTMAPGFGLGWAQLNPDAAQPAAEIRLQAEQVIRGKLVDLNGQPAAGVELRVENFGEAKNLGRLADTSLYGHAPADARTWPRRPKSDDLGRFVFHGVGRGHFVSFVVGDSRFAQQWLGIATDDRDGPKEVTLALQPAKIIEGRVLAADTGRPIPNALIDVGADRKNGTEPSKYRADAQGRFRANPYPADHFTVTAFPPEGEPYLPASVGFDWIKGAIKSEVDVKLRRGIVIEGKVTEEGSGRGLAGASVQYLAINAAEGKGGWEAMVASREDGLYRIVVPAGKGHLLVFGPTADFIFDVIGDPMLFYGQPGGRRNYAHRIIAYEVKAGEPPRPIDAALRPGNTIKGRVIGPRGEAVDHAAIITRLHIESFNTFWRGDYQLHARDGSFELHGLDPEKAVPAYFLDADHDWGATLDASGKLARDGLTVQLQPCGRARARFVGPDGQPVAKLPLWRYLEILAAPGPPAFSRGVRDRAALMADSWSLAGVDREHYSSLKSPVTDDDGRVTLPALIPGASYRLRDLPGAPYRTRNKDFTVKPGEMLDLGEIVIEKPQP